MRGRGKGRGRKKKEGERDSQIVILTRLYKNSDMEDRMTELADDMTEKELFNINMEAHKRLRLLKDLC